MVRTWMLYSKFIYQLVWLVSARFTSLKSKKYTKLKYPKRKAKATIGTVDGIQEAIFKPEISWVQISNATIGMVDCVQKAIFKADPQI